MISSFCKSEGRKKLIVLLLLFVEIGVQVFAQKTGQSSDNYSSDPKMLAVGQQLFENNCSSCHNFSQRSIGPSLQQATIESKKVWLKKFIRNAPAMITSGDTRATQLFEEYKQMMPPFTSLGNNQVEAILAFIHKNQQASANQPKLVDTAIKDPIPAKIPQTGGQLYLQYQSTAPATSTTAPLARINKMQVLKGPKERLFVIDLQGILYEITDSVWQIAMDIRPLRPHFTTSPGLGTGFGSFAFHPDFNENGLLYTTHAEKAHSLRGDLSFADSIKVGLQWVLTEWKIEDATKLPFMGDSRELLRIDLLTIAHGVQEITFNPLVTKGHEEYGLLYIGIGDGGAAEKKGFYPLCSSAQIASSSVLRIDPLGRNSANKQYGIPPTNPFVDAPDPTILKEIYCRGFRNPNRITWTPDGKMLIDDIGQSNIEEVNLGIAGADYGWPEREGTFLVNPREDINKVFVLPTTELPKKYTYPILQYDHDEGRAISGGFVYDGRAIPALKNKYIFSDITNGRVFMANNQDLELGKLAPIQELEVWVDNELTTFQKLNGTAKPDSRLGIGLGGELYFFTKADGKLYKVVDFRAK
ncbi:PQQ-dependent sugar dehydrogenase [Runella sp. MFBS21]|uniref:PQQ-dependent sugar dehydrogenase n=1 Tax=Runella sp. MFBS21 TaxID=3034018 RepID=UPI0023F8A09D|nr:PQQ-dependent sugar dehydrogenase [Runella sp. MFBS21]MDF7818212.1 PQQ-dependent sugar dehydrogenase [Runella sp. MFBS21]